MLGTKWIMEWEWGDLMDPGRDRSPSTKAWLTPLTSTARLSCPFPTLLLSLGFPEQGFEVAP